MPDRELLGEQVIEQRGPWRRMRRWWRGVHPHIGAITLGWTGLETVEEFDRIRPLHTVEVKGEAT